MYWESPYEYCANNPVKWFDTTGLISLNPIIDCIRRGGSGLGDLVKSLRKRNCLPVAGKHAGTIRDLCNLDDEQIEKGIRSTAATIADHIERGVEGQTANQISLLACYFNEFAKRKANGTWRNGKEKTWSVLGWSEP